MWLALALISSMGWAFVHVLDAWCVGRVFERPWFGVITSGLCSILVVLVLPFVQWSGPSMAIVCAAVCAGGLIQISQLFYFQSLNISEPGIIAAYWNLVPAMLPITTFFVFGRILSVSQYSGILLLVGTSLWMSLLDSNLRSRWHSLSLMILASMLQVAAVLLADIVYQQTNFLLGFVLMTTGVIGVGVVPLFAGRIRKQLWQHRRCLIRAAPLLLGIEVINLLALLGSQRALDLGLPSLVAAVETTIPAHAFLISFLLVTAGSDFGQPEAKTRLLEKFACVAAMPLGVWLVS